MEWVRRIRVSADLTQEEVARRVGVNRATFTKIENGKLRPSVSLAKRLGTVLGIDWTRFYEEQNEEVPA